MSDVEIEHMVYVSESDEARMNILRMYFSAKFGEIVHKRNPMLILSVFPGKCVKLSPYLDKPFSYLPKVSKLITKVRCEIALGADPTRTQVVHRNYLVEIFPRDNELPSLLSNYEKPNNDDKTEHFSDEYAKNRLSQLN